MMEFILSLPVIGLAMLLTRTYPGPLILLYPFGVVVQFFLMYGLALLISSVVMRRAADEDQVQQGPPRA